jgi:hypothetical protein
MTYDGSTRVQKLCPKRKALDITGNDTVGIKRDAITPFYKWHDIVSMQLIQVIVQWRGYLSLDVHLSRPFVGSGVEAHTRCI